MNSNYKHLSSSCYVEQERWPFFIMLYFTGTLTCLHHTILNRNTDLSSSYYTEQECRPVFIMLYWTGTLTCLHHTILNRNANQPVLIMGILPDTQNCGSRMHRECRERFPRHRGLAVPSCITVMRVLTNVYWSGMWTRLSSSLFCHQIFISWFILGRSFICGWRENRLSQWDKPTFNTYTESNDVLPKWHQTSATYNIRVNVRSWLYWYLSLNLSDAHTFFQRHFFYIRAPRATGAQRPSPAGSECSCNRPGQPFPRVHHCSFQNVTLLF